MEFLIGVYILLSVVVYFYVPLYSIDEVLEKGFLVKHLLITVVFLPAVLAVSVIIAIMFGLYLAVDFLGGKTNFLNKRIF